MYFLTELGGLVVVKSDGISWGVPTDESNTDYQVYLAWVAEGNTAEEWTGE